MSWKKVEYYIDKAEVNSSSIDSLYYNKNGQRLWVKFVNGNIAGYAGVPVSVFNEFKNAPSVGRYYNNWVKGAYTGLNGDVDLVQSWDEVPNVVSSTPTFTYEVKYVKTETLSVTAASESEALEKARETVDEKSITSITRYLNG